MSSKVEYEVDVQLTDIGYGVFSKRGYAEEEIIGQVKGKILDDPDHTSEYAVDLGDNISLEPGPPFRFLNHSCEPNCYLVVFDDEPGQLYLAATLEIEPGEALTSDYEWPAEEAVPCKCGKPSCRGWIVAEELVHLILERRSAKTAIDVGVERVVSEVGTQRQ